MSSTDVKLTKKAKKALAFRANKGKSKSDSINQIDVPELEDLDTPESNYNEEEGSKTKKRKRVEGEPGVEISDKGREPAAENVAIEAEGERKKKRQRGKKKSEQRVMKMEEGKSRLILFVGNLPFKVTVEEILTHFAECGEVPQVRLLTPKPTPNPSPHHAPSVRSKGCCFLEFKLSTSLQAALRQHETEFISSASLPGIPDRKINVELSAGGGGNSEGRKTKLVEGRKRLEEERERTKKNKAVREGEAVNSNDKSGKWKRAGTLGAGEIVKEIVKEKKVRDRRIKKVDTISGVDAEAARKAAARALAMSGSNAIKIG